MFKHGIGQQLE